MNGEVRIVNDVPTTFAKLVRDEFDARTANAFSIALSGGSIATSCYEHLARQALDWTAVDFVWGDERCVPLNHKDSNYLLAKHALLDRVGDVRSVTPMECDKGAVQYENVVRELLPLDVLHLGMGADGHTASLFPGSPSLDEPAERLVVKTGDDLHRHERMTLTLSAIAQSRLVVFTVADEAKREMFARVRNGEDFPISRVRAQRVIWLVDETVTPT